MKLIGLYVAVLSAFVLLFSYIYKFHILYSLSLSLVGVAFVFALLSLLDRGRGSAVDQAIYFSIVGLFAAAHVVVAICLAVVKRVFY